MSGALRARTRSTFEVDDWVSNFNKAFNFGTVFRMAPSML